MADQRTAEELARIIEILPAAPGCSELKLLHSDTITMLRAQAQQIAALVKRIAELEAAILAAEIAVWEEAAKIVRGPWKDGDDGYMPTTLLPIVHKLEACAAALKTDTKPT